MAGITESEVEGVALQWLAGLGYAVAHGPDIGPEGFETSEVPLRHVSPLGWGHILLTGEYRWPRVTASRA